MSTEPGTKINRLISSQPHGVVFLSAWLKAQGYSLDLQQRYKKSKWLESIGTGAMKRFGDKVGYEGAIYALQAQSGLTIHPGGRTALSILGKAHYLELGPTRVVLFGAKGEKLPAWFRKHSWGVKVDYYSPVFLPSDVGLVDVEQTSFTIKVSGAARAIMECLYLAPDKQDLLECYELMEGLNNLRPNLVQLLLEQCSSVKVKRLFLYMAEKARHDWLSHVALEEIDMGSGKRSLVSNGVYNSKYRLTVPKELEKNG